MRRSNTDGGNGAQPDVMHTPRRPRLTRRQSERLLDHLDGPEDLAAVLAAAGRPASPGEQRGEAAALAAFRRSATSCPVPETRSRSVRTLTLSRGLVVKVLATTAGLVAMGGVAVATTGHLPTPLTPDRPVSASATTRPTGTPTATPTRTHDGTPTRKADPQRRADTIRHLGACRALAENHRAAEDLTTKPYRDLVTRAGGADKVPTYCGKLLERWCHDHARPATGAAKWGGHTYTFRCGPAHPVPTSTGGAARSGTATPSRPPAVLPSLPGQVTGGPVGK